MAPKKEHADDDPVTAEYDVFITPELQEKLYLLQFPTRERERPYNEAADNKPLELRIKPRSGFVEVDVPLNTSFYYNKRKAKEWSNAAAKAKLEGSVGHGMAAGFAPSTAMRPPTQRPPGQADLENTAEESDDDVGLLHQTLGGQIAQFDRGKPLYMIGAFRGSELHLTKLDGMIQMRPQFHHIDAKAQVERNKSRRDRELAEAPKASEPRIVQQMAKPSQQGEFDLSDTKELLQAAHEEPWSHLEYRDEEEDEAYRSYHNKLFLANTKRAPKLTASLDNEAYLETIGAPRVDARGRTRVKPLTKKQKVQIDLSDSNESDAAEQARQGDDENMT